MASINMNGQQSFLLNDIKQHIATGGNVTHILNVKVSRQPSYEIGTQIKQDIFRHIRGNAITKMVNGVAVAITWRSNARACSAYYHADVGGMFGDFAVKEHTKILLRDMLHTLDDKFVGIFEATTTGLAFLVTCPLVREVVLADDDDEK
jgi:hypothetical protein